jgi:hypothetical protein
MPYTVFSFCPIPPPQPRIVIFCFDPLVGNAMHDVSVGFLWCVGGGGRLHWVIWARLYSVAYLLWNKIPFMGQKFSLSTEYNTQCINATKVHHFQCYSSHECPMEGSSPCARLYATLIQHYFCHGCLSGREGPAYSLAYMLL